MCLFSAPTEGKDIIANMQLTPCRLLPQPGAQFSATAEPDSLHGGGHSTAERALREQLSSARLNSGQNTEVHPLSPASTIGLVSVLPLQGSAQPVCRLPHSLQLRGHLSVERALSKPLSPAWLDRGMEALVGTLAMSSG